MLEQRMELVIILFNFGDWYLQFQIFCDKRVVLLWTLDSTKRDAFLANEATKRWTSSNQVLLHTQHEFYLVNFSPTFHTSLI